MKPKKFPVVVKEGGVIARIYRHQNKGYEEFKMAYYEADHRRIETFADFGRAHARAIEVVRLVRCGDHATLTLKADDRLLYQRAARHALRPKPRLMLQPANTRRR